MPTGKEEEQRRTRSGNW